MKNIKPFIIAGTALLLIAAGCRKQKSTLDTVTVPDSVDTSFREPYSFSDVDTSANATFGAAELAEELARKAREALQPVYFEYNSYTLATEAMDRLAAIASFMKENPGLRVLVQGHCDERGSSEYNMGLGENRARVVKDFLINYGVQPIRFETTSLGKEQPAELNCFTNESCHSKNRRADFTVLSR